MAIYHKLSTLILDDSRFGVMPDDVWKAEILKILNDPNNIFYDYREQRYSWNLYRRKRRPEVFARDINICKYCGSTESLEVDHIIPLARGGSNELDNLQILCKKCNRKKWANI
jgi:5-methylcytosine-specific restriction endonuclease McrA